MQRSYDTGALFCLQSPRIAHVAGTAEDVALEGLRGLSDDLAELARWTWTTSSERERDGALKVFHDLLATVA